MKGSFTILRRRRNRFRQNGRQLSCLHHDDVDNPENPIDLATIENANARPFAPNFPLAMHVRNTMNGPTTSSNLTFTSLRVDLGWAFVAMEDWRPYLNARGCRLRVSNFNRLHAHFQLQLVDHKHFSTQTPAYITSLDRAGQPQR